MNITKQYITHIIKEELGLMLNESEAGAPIYKGYLGWQVPNNLVDTQGVDPRMISNRTQRDGQDTYHITIISPPETREIMKKLKAEKGLSGGQAKKAVKSELLERTAALSDSSFTIGKIKSIDGPGDGSVGAKGEPSAAVFKTVISPDAQALRAEYGLPPKDLHITLGIGDNGDVHGTKN
jgi:hypothetical protein